MSNTNYYGDLNAVKKGGGDGKSTAGIVQNDRISAEFSFLSTSASPFINGKNGAAFSTGVLEACEL